MKYIVIVFSLMILFSGCNNREKHDLSAGQDLYIVDFEQCLTTEREMKISEIADTVEYLELKTPEDIIITRILNIIPVDDELIIHSRDGVFKFTKKGDYIKKIGHAGQGPGEYSIIFSVIVDFIKKEIILATSGKVLFYDLDGSFLRSEKWGTLFRIGISNSVLWVSELAHRTNKFIAFALNCKGDTITSIPNPYYGMKSLDEGMGISYSKFIKMFYHNKGRLYLKGKEVNDTIFELSGVDKIPYAYLNMGKYKLPVEYEAWYSNDAYFKNGHRFWGVPAVAEDEHYLYLLSHRYSSIDGDQYNFSKNKDNYRYIIYDKEEGTGFVVKHKENMKIIDNILCGPAIWPHWITDDYYINVIEAHDLLNEVEKGGYTLDPSFEKQLAGFGNNTNQLIILCRRKK